MYENRITTTVAAVDLGIAGKRAAVAAASDGLGLASARALAAEGAKVAICGRHRDRLDEAASRVGGDVTTIVCDVAGIEGGRSFVDAAIDALGGIDILVPNAGGPSPGTFTSTAPGAYQGALELNLLSTIGMVKAATPAMVERGWGRVVAITSLSVRQPIGTLILSNTARAGATAFLKTAALELAGTGVTVNTVQPGLHRTQRVVDLHGSTDGVPVGEPEDFGSVVTFLCSEQAKFVTGASVNVDGGAYLGLQ